MNDEIISKIKKLLRLGQSDNEHEAALAAASAQRLMEKYNISQMMLEGASREDQEEIGICEEPLYRGGKNRSQWRGALAAGIANANSCICFTSGGTIHIIGRASDIEASRYLFKYCEREIDRLSKNYSGHGKGWINNYKIGAVVAVTERLKEAKKQAREEIVSEHGNSASSAIALVDRRSSDVQVWAKQNATLRSGSSFGRQSVHATARTIGYNDGKKINLGSGKGLSSGAKARLEG